MLKLVIFTGAGISAESGLRTFRDQGGLWEDYRIEDVATPEAWRRNPALVQTFYNERRKQVLEAKPNKAHELIVELEKHFDVYVITQNIDDLHERAGSSKVLHLHGEIRKARSSTNASLIYAIDGWELKLEQCCEEGSPLRPNIVWFGEEVPALLPAAKIVEAADIFVVIGSSLQVYPAASLVHETRPDAIKFLIDPHEGLNVLGFRIIRDTASKGMPVLSKLLVNEFSSIQKF